MGVKSVPVALPATLLLDLLRVGVDVTGLGKVTGKVFLGGSGPIGQGDVITIVEFMGTSHCQNKL